MPWVDAVEVSEVTPGTPAIINVGGRRIGVFHEGGKYHAVLDHCPHRGAPICQGQVEHPVVMRDGRPTVDTERHVLRCPWHRWEFDLCTGKAEGAIPQRLRHYPVRRVGDRLEVKLPDA